MLINFLSSFVNLRKVDETTVFYTYLLFIYILFIYYSLIKSQFFKFSSHLFIKYIYQIFPTKYVCICIFIYKNNRSSIDSRKAFGILRRVSIFYYLLCKKNLQYTIYLIKKYSIKFYFLQFLHINSSEYRLTAKRWLDNTLGKRWLDNTLGKKRSADENRGEFGSVRSRFAMDRERRRPFWL